MMMAAAICISAAQGRAEDVFYKTGPFDHLSVRGDVNVVYRCVPDSTGIARYDDTGFPDEPFEVTSNKGKVMIKVDPKLPAGTVLPTIYIYSDFLIGVVNEGSGDMTLHLTAATPTFSARLIGNGRITAHNVNSNDVMASMPTGNGQITLDGKCRQADFKMVATGTIQADRLEAVEVECKVMGTGTIGCWAEKRLDVRGIGTTKIYYKGDPAVKKVGGAKLYRLTDESIEVSEEADPEVTVVTADDK